MQRARDEGGAEPAAEVAVEVEAGPVLDEVEVSQSADKSGRERDRKVERNRDAVLLVLSCKS